MQKSIRAFWALAALLCLPVVAPSAVIVVGDHMLLPNMANQHVEIFITGGDLINASDLAASVGTGNQVNGPNQDDGPTITAADIIGAPGFNPTIFTGNNSTTAVVEAPGPTKRTIEIGTTTDQADFSAVANGRLGTLVFSTIGIVDAGFLEFLPLTLGGPGNNTVPGFLSTDIGTDNVGGTLYPTITDGGVFFFGSESQIPEPSSIVLALFALAGLAVVAISRRRSAGR